MKQIIKCIFITATICLVLSNVVAQEWKAGVIDKTGNFVVFPQYDEIRDFHEGLAAVKKGELWSFVDKNGKEIIQPQYSYVGDFHEGLAVVERKGGEYGFIDNNGNEVILSRYEDIWDFHEGLAVVKKDDKYGCIDNNGNEVIPPRYDRIWHFHEGLASVKIRGKWGFIDKTGREVVSPHYDDCLEIFQEDLAAVGIDRKWGFIDKKGKEVVPLKYTKVRNFKNGYAAVERETGSWNLNKWGFIDKTGREVIPPCYLEVSDFNDDIAMVKKIGIECWIDRTGKEITPCYDNYFIMGDYFHEGLAVVCIDNKCGFLDKTGKEAIPLRYERANSFCEGLAIVYVKTDDITLFEKKKKQVQEFWNKCNQQLIDYPYNTEKLQLEPVSLTNYFLDPRLEIITDSIVAELKQITKELQDDCFKRLKTKKSKVFSEIYLEQHPEAKPVLENLKLECRCKNYSEAELVIKIADNTVPQCTCRNDYWNLYGNLFSSRTEFDNTYNTSEQGFLDDVKLRQSLKADIQEIASMLSGLKAPKFKDGLTGKNEDIIQLLKKVQYHKGKYYYNEVVDMMFAADAAMTKEWEKNGSLFSSRNEFYEAYVSGEYKNVLKEKKR